MNFKKVFLIILYSTALNTSSIFASQPKITPPKQPGIFFNWAKASLFSTGLSAGAWFGLQRFAPHIIEKHGETKVIAGLGLFTACSSSYYFSLLQRKKYNEYSNKKAQFLAQQQIEQQLSQIRSKVKILEKTINEHAHELAQEKREREKIEIISNEFTKNSHIKTGELTANLANLQSQLTVLTNNSQRITSNSGSMQGIDRMSEEIRGNNGSSNVFSPLHSEHGES